MGMLHMMHAHFTPNSGQMSIAAVRISNYRRANKRTATMDIAANKPLLDATSLKWWTKEATS
jgi:hypothetical protein